MNIPNNERLELEKKAYEIIFESSKELPTEEFNLLVNKVSKLENYELESYELREFINKINEEHKLEETKKELQVEKAKRQTIDQKSLSKDKKEEHDAVFYDKATGLYNRKGLSLAKAIIFDPNYKNISVASIDANHFKLINEVYGEEFGDLGIMIMSKHINNTVNELKKENHKCEAVRMGGEEFVIFCSDIDSNKFEETLNQLNENIGNELKELIKKRGNIDTLSKKINKKYNNEKTSENIEKEIGNLTIGFGKFKTLSLKDIEDPVAQILLIIDFRRRKK